MTTFQNFVDHSSDIRLSGQLAQHAETGETWSCITCSLKVLDGLELPTGFRVNVSGVIKSETSL